MSNAVIAPNLVQDLSLNIERLGLLGGAFFYSFALIQIPMGILLDRVGPRLVITVFTFIGALGSFVFAGSHNFLAALVGRILIGIGMASMLMGSMKIFVLRFPLKLFATLSGTLVSIGTLGSFLASSPLAYFAITIGWRMTFVYTGIITAIFGCLAFITLGEKRTGQNHTAMPSSSDPEQNMPISKIIKLVLGNLSFWQIGFFGFFRYGTYVALQGLWLGPYLMGVKGFSPIQAGNLLMLLSVGFVVGAPISGYLADRVFLSNKITLLIGVGSYALSLLPLTGICKLDTPLSFSITFFIIGFFSSFGTLTFSHAKQIFPLNISGTVIAGINFFAMIGGAILMPVMGKVIEASTPPGVINSPHAYHLSFLICFLGMAASTIFYVFSKDKK